MTTPAAHQLGAGDPCPLCRATAGVVEDSEGFACAVCGAPRVVADGGVPPDAGERALLEHGKRLRTRRAAWGIGAAVSGVAGGGALVVAFLLSHFAGMGEMASGVVWALAAAPWVLSGFGVLEVRRLGKAARTAYEEAEVKVAAALARQKPEGLDAPELARILHVPPARAEELLARVQVEGFLATGTEEANPGPRFRVDSGEAPEGSVSPEADAQKSRLPR